MLECNVIVNKLVKGSFVIIVIGKGSLLSDTVGGALVSSTCTVFAYTEHLRAGADPGETAGTESNCKAVQDRPLEERNRPLPVIRPAAMLNYLVVREASEGPLHIKTCLCTMSD